MDFEEWYREAKKTNDCGFTAKDFFDAGQQSKQSEIDGLKAKIEEIIKLVHDHTPDYWLDNMIKELLK